MNKELTNKTYWESNFGKLDFFKFSNSIPEDKYISNFLSPDKNKTCIEIGAYPGGNLGYFVKKFSFQPTAIDFLNNSQFILENMKYNGIENCKLINEDFLKWNPDQQYDVVVSFGFVEHFTNYEEVIQKHIDILKKEGILIISVPYLEYFQLWIRRFLYKSTQYKKILDSHNRNIMNLKELNTIIFETNNLTKLFSGFIREMTIWFPKSTSILRKNRMKYYDFFKKMERIIGKIDHSSSYYSPEILVIAKK